MFRKVAPLTFLMGLTFSSQCFALKTPDQLVEDPRFRELLLCGFDEQKREDTLSDPDFLKIELSVKCFVKGFLVRFVEKPYHVLNKKYADKTTAKYEKKIESCFYGLANTEDAWQMKKEFDESGMVELFTRQSCALYETLEELIDFLVKKHGKTIEIARFVSWMVARSSIYIGLESVLDNVKFIKEKYKDENYAKEVQRVLGGIFSDTFDRICSMASKKFGFDNTSSFTKAILENIEKAVIEFVFIDVLPVLVEIGVFDSLVKKEEPAAN